MGEKDYSLPGYDAWKSAYPPEYDDVGFECDRCGKWIEGDENGVTCPDCEEMVEEREEDDQQ